MTCKVSLAWSKTTKPHNVPCLESRRWSQYWHWPETFIYTMQRPWSKQELLYATT